MAHISMALAAASYNQQSPKVQSETTQSHVGNGSGARGSWLS